jgi:hypothetical protein
MTQAWIFVHLGRSEISLHGAVVGVGDRLLPVDVSVTERVVRDPASLAVTDRHNSDLRCR